MDLENILNKVSSPAKLDSVLVGLKDIQIPKMSSNILRHIQNVLNINNKDMKQFMGILITFEIFKNCLNHQFTDADWLKLHADYSKVVLLTFDCILQYRTTVILKEDKFCKLVLDISKLLFPIVSSVDSVRCLVLQDGFKTLSALICIKELDIIIRKEIFSFVKPILVKSNSRQRKFIMATCNLTLCCFAKLIIECGDYEIQEDLTEILMRFSYVSKNKLNRISLWFQNYINDLNIIKKLDYSNFDTSCRDFLNTLNSANRSKVKVITLPCLEAFANDLQLRKPNTEKYLELWVDFSISTGNIHIVCDGGGNAWSRLILSQHNVKRITCSKRVKHDASCAEQFLIELISPLSVFLCSCEKYIATVTIIFLKSPKINELQEVFFKKCYSEAYEVEKPLMIQSNIGRKNTEITCSKQCFCNVSSISSIHSAKSPKQNCFQKAINKVVTSNPSVEERSSFSFTTSTPHPVVGAHSGGKKIEKIGLLEGAHLRRLSTSKINENLSFDEFINKNKWNKSSSVKYKKNPCTSDDDRKFKEICEMKLSQIRNQHPNSSQTQSQGTELKSSKLIKSINEQNQFGIEVNNNNIKLPVVKSIINTTLDDKHTTNTPESHLTEDSPFTLSIKPSMPNDGNNPNTKKQENVLSKASKLQNIKNLSNSSRLQLSAEPPPSNCNFKIPNAAKNKPSFPSNPKPSEIKKNHCILQLPKLNVLKPPMGSNKPLEGLNFNYNKQVDGFKNFSQTANSLTFSSLKLLNKTSFQNQVNQQSQNVFNSMSLEKDHNISISDKNKEQNTKQFQPLESCNKDKYKYIQNISCPIKNFKPSGELSSGKEDFFPKKLNSIHKNALKQSSVSDKLSSVPEGNNHIISEGSHQPTATKTTKVIQSDLLKLNKLSDEKKSDIYEWSSSRSITDNEGNSFPSFKLLASNYKSELQKTDSILSMKENKKYSKDQNSSNSNGFKDIELLSRRKNKEGPSKDNFQGNNHTHNSSLHCKIPSKTYSINKTNLLNTTTDNLFEFIKKKRSSNLFDEVSNKQNSRKRKLYNPNDSWEGEKNIVNLSPELINKRVKNESRNFKKTKDLPCEPKVPNIHISPPKKEYRRRSLRLMKRVKSVYYSSEDNSSDCKKQIDSDSNCLQSDKKINLTPDNVNNINISSDDIIKNPTSLYAPKGDETKRAMNISPTGVTGKLDLRKKIVGPRQLDRCQPFKEKDNCGLVKNLSKSEFLPSFVEVTDDIREESHCKLSLQGIPPEEGKSDDSILELVEPPLRVSTDNSSPSILSPSNPDPSRADSIGTQADARAELAFLENVISGLGQMTLEGPRKKILTETGSLERTIKKVELFSHSSNKNFSKKFIELKKKLLSMLNDLDILTSSHDDYINSLGAKMADVGSTMNRLSKSIENDQDLKLKVIKDMESLCKQRRNVVREERMT